MIEGRAETRIHPAVTPAEEDLVITRHRTSAFTGSELAQILSANEVETLFLAGFATSGVVLSTALEGDDRDFGVVVLSDCVADPDPDLHRLLLQEVFPAHGHVADSAELLAALPS
jgi:nicotinamidase-related amidase